MDAHNALNIMYTGRWTGRGSPINWPAHSPDYSCLDFFLWGHKKSLIYEDGPVDSTEDLVAWISVVAVIMRKMPGVFTNVRGQSNDGLKPALLLEAATLNNSCNGVLRVVYFHFVE